MTKRKIAVFTGNRAEYGLLNPVIKALSVEDCFDTYLIISGSHLSDSFGRTATEIDTSCVKTVKEINIEVSSNDKKKDMLLSFSIVVNHGVDVLNELHPDLIVLAGDRYETFAMAVTAFYMNIPVAHLFGGDLSQGGHLDDSARHSITKLAHLHFTSNEDSYKRILGLGEEPWRVFNVGSTAIDNSINGEYLKPEEIVRELDIDTTSPVIVFTQHPVTTESELSYTQAKESLEALKELGYQTIITYPCNDAGGEDIIKAISEYKNYPFFKIKKSLGWKHYIGLLKIVSVVVGNSSSGIMETPIFRVPCVNIGSRQAGRLQAGNVIDVPYDKDEIKKAIIKAMTDSAFIEKVKKCSNPYGDGGASGKIADILKSIPLNRTLLQKQMTY